MAEDFLAADDPAEPGLTEPELGNDFINIIYKKIEKRVVLILNYVNLIIYFRTSISDKYRNFKKKLHRLFFSFPFPYIYSLQTCVRIWQ